MHFHLIRLVSWPNGALLHTKEWHPLWSCILFYATYSLMNFRQIHIFFNWAQTWQLIVCLLLCFSPFLPVFHQKLFYFDVQNNFRHKTGKNREHKSKQTISCHVLALLKKTWICLIFIIPKGGKFQSGQCQGNSFICILAGDGRARDGK